MALPLYLGCEQDGLSTLIVIASPILRSHLDLVALLKTLGTVTVTAIIFVAVGVS